MTYQQPNSVNEPEHWKAVCNESCMHGLGRGGWKRIRSRFSSLPSHTGARTPAQAEHLASRLLHLDRWERLGVTLVLCDFPMLGDLSNPFGKAMVQLVAVFAEIERKLISQRTKEALAMWKRKGHASGKFPGYGMKWERRWDREQGKYVKVRVADPDERQVMREIVKRRLDGDGWEAITVHLANDRILTKDGKPWSRSRVQRAFQAELEFQRSEAEGTGRQ